MSAIISNKVMMKEVLKATGFDCPDGMENKTFEEAASGGGEGRTPQELNVTANGNYNTPDGVYYGPISVNVPLNAVGVTIVMVKSDDLRTVGTPVAFSHSYKSSLDSNYVVWVGNEQINTRDLKSGQTYNYTISHDAVFDITLIKRSIGGGMYRINVEYKDRGVIRDPLNCFLIIGTLN